VGQPTSRRTKVHGTCARHHACRVHAPGRSRYASPRAATPAYTRSHLWGETTMWGHRLPRPRAARLTALAGLLLLTACATHGPTPQAGTAPPSPPTGERDATGAYRFNMTQHGRRMTADEFDAWMKARGIRVAK